jgi:thymidylate synthase
MSTSNHLDSEWRETLSLVSSFGDKCAPRGYEIRELLNHTIRVDMRYPVLIEPLRKVNYRFMFAEAAWILSGSNSLDELTPYNSNMAKFSDDGVTLDGAYGPRFVRQLDYVARALFKDRDTRQATMTIWSPNPEPSKDIPCTVAIDFKLRRNRLHAQVFMRSSDVWLGVPYDVFSFTMMTCEVLRRLNYALGHDVYKPGTLYLTAASSHIYTPEFYNVNKDTIRHLCETAPDEHQNLSELPTSFYSSINVTRTDLVNQLKAVRDNKELRWW